MGSVNVDKYVTFRGHPLVLCDNNFIVYGNLSEQAFAEIIIMGEQEIKNGETSVTVPGMMMVTIKSTKDGNEVLRANEFKNGLWEALDYSYEQIERFNRKK